MTDDRIPERSLGVSTGSPTDMVRVVKGGVSMSVPMDSLPVPSSVQAKIDALSAAQTAGMLGFATKALMDADTSQDAGTLALVTNDSTASNNGTYRWSGSAWVLSADRVTGLESETANYRAAGDPMLPVAPAGFAWALVDAAGRAAAGVREDGTFEAGALEAESVEAESVQANSIGTSSGNLYSAAPYGYAFAIIDAGGNAACGVTDAGVFVLADMRVERINGVLFDALAQAEPTLPTARNYTAEVNMVLSYGQSLAVGTDSTPVITTTQRFDSIRFDGGVRTQDDESPYGAFAPLVETQASTLGETPCAGATDMVKELILSEDGLSFTDHSYQLLASAPGAGGTAIAGLVKGTAPYTRFMDDVDNGFALAQADNKSFKVQAFFWTQGESDYSASTSAVTYKSALVGLRDDIDADCKAVTGQVEDVACISYQTQAHATYGHSNDAYLAVAQLQVARDNPNHYVACPLYWSAQAVHQSAENSKILGAYYGLCYKRVVIDGTDWKPVMPVAVNRQGKVALVRFHVPHGALVFDTAFRAAQTNMGFSMVDGSGVAITIASVDIVGHDMVKIVAATTIPSGAKLRYGFGSGGNLRDKQGEVIIFDGDGIDFPMHNWCCIFEEVL